MILLIISIAIAVASLSISAVCVVRLHNVVHNVAADKERFLNHDSNMAVRIQELEDRLYAVRERQLDLENKFDNLDTSDLERKALEEIEKKFEEGMQHINDYNPFTFGGDK